MAYYNDKSACPFSSLKGFEFYLSQHELNIAAFQLHQVADRLYSAIALVDTRYKPKSHDLVHLEQRAASVEPKFLQAFPMDTLICWVKPM